jgi:ABC-type dipeptide/oligopeptide/nickel transport system ATPase subunit
MALIEIESLQVSFPQGNGHKIAVESVSFAVEAGETFSLIGASGCGKSTVLRVLAGCNVNGVAKYGCSVRPCNPSNASPASYAATCRWCSKIPTLRCTRSIRLPVRWVNR